MGFFPSYGTFHYFVIRTPYSLPHGRHNLIISRRTLSETNILTSILSTRASRNLGLLQGLRKVGDLGSNCRIPCHWKVAPLKIVATWPQSWRVTQGEDAKSVHGYVATWLPGYVATWLRGYGATELRRYIATELQSYVATWLRGYGATELQSYVATWLRGYVCSSVAT